MTLGAYDILVIAALATGFLLGRSKGFAWQVSGIATIVVGYLAAALGSGLGARFFPETWPDDLRRYAAWVGIYGLVSLAIYLVTLKLSKKIKEHELEDLDKRWGAGLGTFKAALLLAVGSLVAIAASERAREAVRESITGPYLARGALLARPILPDRIGNALAECASHVLGTPPDEPTGPTPPAPPPQTQPPAPTPARPAKPPRPTRTSKRPGVTHETPRQPSTFDLPATDDEPPMARPETPGEPDPYDVPATEPVDPLAPPR